MSELAPRLLVVGYDPESGAIGEAIADSEFDPEVLTVADRDAALTVLDRQRVDCVVSGYEIPNEDGQTYMGGLRLLEAVRAEHGDLPFVLFTTVVNEDSIRLAAANGVRAYVRDQEGEDVVAQLRYHVDSALRGQLAERRAAEQDRINELMRSVTQTLVLEEDRDAMLAALCAKLTEQDVYRFAAYHQRAPSTNSRTRIDEGPEATAGDAAADAVATPLLRRCVEHGEVETAELRRSLGEADDHAWESVLRIAVPISYEDERFGVLVLETDSEHTFFESETDVLAELGEAIGHALTAVETREALRDRERELEHRTEQLEGFASLVSHDVRNPLNVAQGYVGILQERVEDDALDEIDASLDRIETIVDDILALTRGERELALAPVALDDVVADAWANVDTQNASIEVGTLPRIEADASQLQRVFENLFRNAVEHGMPQGDGAIVVTVAYEDGVLRVEDDGVGFTEGAADDLFELGETGTDGGTGIGLAIVSGLIEQHDWSVTAENRETGGARFRISGIDPIE